MFEIIQSMILKWSYKNVMVWSTLIPMCTVSLGFSPFRFEYNDDGDGDDDDDDDDHIITTIETNCLKYSTSSPALELFDMWVAVRSGPGVRSRTLFDFK